MRYDSVRDAFIRFDLCDPSDHEEVLRAYQVIRQATALLGYSWHNIANIVIRDHDRKQANKYASARATRSFGREIKYWFDTGGLISISDEHAFVLKGMIEQWIYKRRLSDLQTTYAADILMAYAIKIAPAEFEGSWDDMEDIAAVSRWHEEFFSETSDLDAIHQVMRRANNTQYGSSHLGLFFDVQEELSYKNNPLTLTMGLFIQSLLGRGNPVVRQEICTLLETHPRDLWVQGQQDNKSRLARLSADARRFDTRADQRTS